MSNNAEIKALAAKLDGVAARYQELTAQLNDPIVAGNPSKIVAISKEHGQLRRMAEAYAKYKEAAANLAESEAIIDDQSQDAEFRELAREELPDLRDKADALIERLKDLLVTGDDAAISSIIMEIRSGTGGDEAALFSADLYQMYLRFAEVNGFKVEVLDHSDAEMGGLKEIVLSIKGPGVFTRFGYEGGGHRVQRVPKTESQGRVHTSAATVAVLPEIEEVDIDINWEKDVLEHVSRAGGPGGQNVNKVASAIKLEHIPTGITVSMRDDKSQHKNRAKARRILISRVHDKFIQEQENQRAATRKTMIGSGDRSQRIRTYNFPQNRCTDHRINQDYSLEKIMGGDLDTLVTALYQQDKIERLKNL
jgi:peptide chain release factor 1